MSIQAESYSNKISDKRQLLVMSAPSVHDTYYRPLFEDIVRFQSKYALAIMGKDNVVIVVDEDTYPFYANQLPEDILLIGDLADIWIRDFSTVNPYDPVLFRYTSASTSQGYSQQVQRQFETFATGHGLEYRWAPYFLDGGNVVDNYDGDSITTYRVLEDNELSENEIAPSLNTAMTGQRLAIISTDEDRLAHSDGMVMWADTDTLLVNDYRDFSKRFNRELVQALKETFPDRQIRSLPSVNRDAIADSWPGFSSACGVYVNAVLTERYLYVPVFGLKEDAKMLRFIRRNSNKSVVPVNASGVCRMGGSVRCLTWQVSGQNANRLILAARQ